MSLEIVGNTINGLSGEAPNSFFRDFTSAEAEWTASGDTGSLTYGSGGATLTGVASGSSKSVTFTFNSVIHSFISASIIGSTNAGAGSQDTTIAVTLDGVSKSVSITGENFEGAASISCILVENTWYVITTVGAGDKDATGSTQSTHALSTYSVTGPGKAPTVVVTVAAGAGTSAGVATMTRIMYA